jgi:hypothetical protein
VNAEAGKTPRPNQCSSRSTGNKGRVRHYGWSFLLQFRSLGVQIQQGPLILKIAGLDGEGQTCTTMHAMRCPACRGPLEGADRRCPNCQRIERVLEAHAELRPLR